MASMSAQAGHERRFRPGAAVFWAATWGIGVALGVALGGWLTAVGGAGAPGAQAVQPLTDLVLLPAAAFGVVFVVHFGAQVVAALIRGRSHDPAQ